MARRSLQFTDFGQVLEDVNQLHRCGYEKQGQWDLGQICDHLGAFVRGTLDGYTFHVPWLFRFLFAGFALRRIMKTGKMPSGISSPIQASPPGVDEGAAVARFRQDIERLQAHQGEWHPSPFFGRLTPQQWRQLHLIHCAHHLGHLVPK